MARRSEKPRYFPSKNGWFMTFNGQTIRLTTGPQKATRKEAFDKYRAEMGARMHEVKGDGNYVCAILNDYLEHLSDRVKKGDASQNTLDLHEKLLRPFNEQCGDLTVRQLRPKHIEDFLLKMKQPRWSVKKKRMLKWGDPTSAKAYDVIKAVFKWAANHAGSISRSPLDRPGGKKARRRRRRPSEARVAITDAEHQLLLRVAQRRKDQDFAHLLTVLFRTGARPAEVHGARADEWDESRQAIVIKAIPENRGRYKLWHLGDDRVVYIPTDLVPLVKAQMEKYPTGTIFRSETGAAWTCGTICSSFRSLKRAANRYAAKHGLAPVRAGVSAYSGRHRVVTDWVEQDRPVWKLCELLNTSEAMLRRHYSHLFERTETLRGALDDFDRAAKLPVENAQEKEVAASTSGSPPLGVTDADEQLPAPSSSPSP